MHDKYFISLGGVMAVFRLVPSCEKWAVIYLGTVKE